MPKNFKRLFSLERRTKVKRNLSKLEQPNPIHRMFLEEITISDCNLQNECPLFNKIPPEVRNDIFSYVLSEQDGQSEISIDDYCYRPDYTHFRYVDTALLRTCRLIWLETNALPRKNVLQRVWLGQSNRGPSRLQYAQRADRNLYYFDGPMDHYRTRKVLPSECVQVFAQMFALEQNDLDYLRDSLLPKTTIRRLIITIRYTDWWWWESDAALTLKNSWVEEYRAPNTVEEIVVEFETRNGKKGELDYLLQHQVSKWQFALKDGTALTLRERKPIASTYVGSARPGGGQYEHHKEQYNGGKNLGDDKMLYYVAKMIWRKT